MHAVAALRGAWRQLVVLSNRHCRHVVLRIICRHRSMKTSSTFAITLSYMRPNWEREGERDCVGVNKDKKRGEKRDTT